jgi:CBS domain-containing protein
MTTSLTASDIMHSPVVQIEANASISEAWKTLDANTISGAPVCNDSGVAIGVVSQSDLLRGLLKRDIGHYPTDSFYVGAPMWGSEELKGAFEQLTNISVQEVMSAGVVAISPNATLTEIAQLMTEQHIHRVLVVDEQIPVGIVTTFDVLSLIANNEISIT